MSHIDNFIMMGMGGFFILLSMALRLGGWIMIAIGIVLIILGGVFLAIE